MVEAGDFKGAEALEELYRLDELENGPGGLGGFKAHNADGRLPGGQ